MVWKDRVTEPAYTSPSGARETFMYENVSKTFDKKTSAYEFPDADGTFIQDLGVTGRRYPLRLIINGKDYDITANKWEKMLSERGTGQLEHPIYGKVNVVPFGTVSRRDDLKSAGNQAIIEVTFFETIDIVYPTTQGAPADAALAAVAEHTDAIADELDKNLDTDTAIEEVTLREQFDAAIDSIKADLQVIADTRDEVERQFNNVVDSVQTSIDVLIDAPLTLAFQTMVLIQAPARALALIGDRLDAYGNLITSIVTGTFASLPLTGPLVNPTPNNSTGTNLFASLDLMAQGFVTGSIISVINNTFQTKEEAISAAEAILDQFNAVVTWRDANAENLGVLDTGSSYQQLQKSVAVVLGFLVEISFTLRAERVLVLVRNRNVIELVAELYGSVDDNLDFFISSNNLSGSEIIELPVGRSVVYYI